MSHRPWVSGSDLSGLFPRVFDDEYLEMESGDGIVLTDADGNEYLDVASGSQNVNIGHGRTEVAEAAYEQLAELEYVPMKYVTESIEAFGESLTSFTPCGFENAWFVSGGSLAVESAMVMARQYHLERGNERKYQFVARRGSYHGTTMGALSATGYELFTGHMQPLLHDFPKIPRGNEYRCRLCGGGGGRECGLRCARILEEQILEAGPEHVAAVIVEPVGGSMSPGEQPHPGYFERIRELCDEYDVLFVVDEVLTGLGRTGENFAIEHYDVTPDIILAGKGLTAGYAPAGAVVPHERVVDVFRDLPHGFGHGHTNAFHPTTAAIGDAVLDVLRREELVANAASLGPRLSDRLEDLYDYEVVGDVRGLGLLHGVEFVADPETKTPLDPDVGLSEALFEAGLDHGLALAPSGGHLKGQRGDLLTIAPPLTVTESELDELSSRLYAAVGDAIERVGL
jgi:adenosylmethionine-8-amino-7-oxononanoate aminotransferase